MIEAGQAGVIKARPKLPFAMDDLPLFLGLGVLAFPTFLALLKKKTNRNQIALVNLLLCRYPILASIM